MYGPAMTRRPGWRLAGAALLVALAAAGCGDDGEEDSADTGSDGPLAEFFGWAETGPGDGPRFSEQERQQHYQIQDLIVACMSEAGFEYTPEQFYGDREEIAEDPNAGIWRLQEDDPARFAREYGYGFTTIDLESQAPPTPGAADDPNLAYRESLPPAAQQEYDRALWGGEAGETGGCQNQAYEQVYGDRTDGERRFDALVEEWDTLYQRIESDPRLDAARQAWSGCMAGAGYPDLTSLHDGQDQVSQRQSELSRDGAQDPAAVEELRQFERDIAVADHTCRQDHDVDGIERTVRFEHEARFIEEHRADLEAYRDWLNEQGIAG
jgi:hypothetical protein